MLCRTLRAALQPVVMVGIAFGAVRPAHADIRVERADDASSCPGTTSFLTRMGDTTAAADVQVRFERTPDGYRSWVNVGGRQRVLADRAPTCDGLAEATVLAVKLALDVEVSPTPAVPLVRAKSTAERPPSSSPPRAPASVAEVSAGYVLALGLATPLASGMRAGGALVLGDDGNLSMGITGVVLPTRRLDVGVGTVDVSALGAGIEGCARSSTLHHSLRLALCGRVEAMRLEGSSHGFERTESRARPLFAGTLLGRGRVRMVGPLALYVEGGAVLPFVRERFSIDSVGVVFDPPIVAATTGIGASVDFE